MTRESGLVFRPSAAAVVVGAIIALPAVVGLFLIVFTGSASGQGKNDPAVVAGELALVALGLAVGAAVLCAGWFVRVDVRADRLRLFNMFNRCVLDAAWHEIESYRRMPAKHRRPALDRWHVSANGSDVTVPQIADLPHLHMALLDRLPTAATAGPPRSTHANATPPGVMSFRLRSSRDALGILFSIFWYPWWAALAVVCLMSALPQKPGGGLDTLAMFGFAGAVIIGAVPSFAFAKAWRRRLRGRIEADGTRLIYDDGTGPVTIAWADLRLVDFQTVQVGEEGTMDVLVLVGRDAAVQIESGFKEFGDLAGMAPALAPESAIVYGKSH